MCSLQRLQSLSPEGRKNSLENIVDLEPIPAGKVRLILHKAERLEKKDVTGKSDPYVVISYNHSRVGETKVCKKSLEPVWEEEFSLGHICVGAERVLEECGRRR